MVRRETGTRRARWGLLVPPLFLLTLATSLWGFSYRRPFRVTFMQAGERRELRCSRGRLWFDNEPERRYWRSAIRGYFARREVRRRRAEWPPHALALDSWSAADATPQAWPNRIPLAWPNPAPPGDHIHRFIRVKNGPNLAMLPRWSAAVPMAIPAAWSRSWGAWPLFGVVGLMMLSWETEWVRRSARRKAGRCPVCGYDLRATPGCCPECGLATGHRSSGEQDAGI